MNNKSKHIKVVDKDGIKFLLDGKLHNLDGPAVIYKDGTVEYYVNGKKVTKTPITKSAKKKSKKAYDDIAEGTFVNPQPDVHEDLPVNSKNIDNDEQKEN